MNELVFSGVAKSFPGVRALDGVSMEVGAGRVHGLLGENGAGKSTLLKILGGEYTPDAGELRIGGEAVRFRSAADAIHRGVAVIHQELQYVPELSVMENLLLGRLPQTWGFVRRRVALDDLAQRLRQLGITLDLRARLRDLSIGQRQMVEICKAILRDARIIALDEPTSSLSHSEAETLFRLVAELKARGKVLIYVSHRLDEVFRLCDGATVLRDGRTVAQFETLEGVTRDELVRKMVGREIRDIYGWRARPIGSRRLVVKGLHGARLPEPAGLTVSGGEIVGVFGLVGAGRSEFMRLIYGADPREGGRVEVDGQALAGQRIGASIRGGLMFCPEDRKEQGIVGCRSVAENINISCRRHSRRLGLFVDDAVERSTADAFIERLRIKTPNREQPIRLLSGGNQQKAVLARWLAERELRVLMVDEPTRGIDVGAKNEIYEVLYGLAAQGVAIVVVSSELPEVLGLSDRIVVMRQGRIAGELARADADEARVLQLALPKTEPQVA